MSKIDTTMARILTADKLNVGLLTKAIETGNKETVKRNVEKVDNYRDLRIIDYVA